MLPVKLPTSEHIAEFLQKHYPDGRVIGRHDLIGVQIINMLHAGSTRTPVKGLRTKFKAQFIFYLNFSGQRFSKSRRFLSLAQISSMNKYLSLLLRQRARDYITTYLQFDRCLTRAADYAMEQLGIQEAIYYKDALIKDFQRYRSGNPELMIHSKTRINAAKLSEL